MHGLERSKLDLVPEIAAAAEMTPLPELPREVVQRFGACVKRCTRMTWFGIGVERENGKHLPIHRNARTDPSPISGHSGKYQAPDRVGRHFHYHLAGLRPFFTVSSDHRRLALLTPEIDASDTSVKFSETAVYAAGLVKGLWGVTPWVEPGRSHPRKQGAYPRVVIDYGGVPAATRALTERLINRFLRARYPRGERSGYHLDGLKGTTAWAEENPLFDARLYHSVHPWRQGRHVNLGPVLDGCDDYWVPMHEAARTLRDLTEDTENALDLGAARDLITQLPQEFLSISYGEAYEKDRCFYGFVDGHFDRSRRFCPDPRLEHQVVHRGLLVTAPCYGRPNDVAAFKDCLGGTPLGWKHLISVLPPEHVEVLREHRLAIKAGEREDAHRMAREALNHSRSSRCTVRPAKGVSGVPVVKDGDAARVSSPPAAEPVNPEIGPEGKGNLPPDQSGHPLSDRLIDTAVVLRRAGRSSDAEVAGDPTAEPFDRWLAMTRMCLRQSGGDVRQTAQMVAAWWEGPEGGATGHSPGEHAERLERFTRLAKFTLGTFDVDKGSSAKPKSGDGSFWLTRERIEAMGPDMDRLIPQEWRDEAAAGHRHAQPLTSVRLAAVYGAIVRLASTVAKGHGHHTLGDAPNRGICGLLKTLGMSVTSSTLAALKGLLQRANLIALTRAHYHPGNPSEGTGRSAAFAVNTSIYCPAWAEPYIPPQVRVDSASTPHELAAAPAPLLPSPLPLDNPVCEHGGQFDLTDSQEELLLAVLAEEVKSYGGWRVGSPHPRAGPRSDCFPQAA